MTHGLQRLRWTLALASVFAGAPAFAQTTATLNATSGSNVISTSYSTTGGLTLELGFALDALVVGGGGGGGARFGGGGGAGGVLYQPEWLITTATQSVVVGGGGTAGVATGGAGTLGAGSGGNGQNSSFASLIGYGGGGGGAGDATNGAAGGSGGGGAGRFTTSGGSGTNGQGNSGGGAGNQVSPYRGGGGGGAGAAGATGGNGTGAGGNGRTLSISGSNVTYGGGGGGGGTAAHGSVPNAAGGPGGTGGGGGGGNWDNSVPAVAGTANTGGGGGGSAYNGSTQYTAAAGGSGLVIVRYQGPQIATGGTATVGTGSSAGYTVHTFTTTGSSSLAFNGLTFSSLGATLTGQLTGAGNLTYVSPGTLTLSASNSFTGTTRATAGTLRLGNANALGGSTLDLNAADAGTIAFTAAAGTTYLLGGLSGSRPLSMGDGSLTVGTNNASTTYSGALSGTGSLTKVGTGSLTLSGSTGHTGGTTVSAGSLVGTTASLRGPIVNNASVEYSQATDGSTAGGMTGTGAIVKSGGGAVTLSGTTNLSGAITVNAGRLVIANNAVGSSGVLTLANTAGAALEVAAGSVSVSRLTGGGTTGGNIALGSGVTLTVREASIDRAQTFGGVISGSGGLTMSGVGALRLQNQQTYTGPTTVSSGVLVASIIVNNSLSGSSAVTLAPSASIDISNRPQTMAGLSGSGGTIYSFTGDGGSGGVLTLAVAPGSSPSFAGTLGGGSAGFAIVKTGLGTQTLSGNNTYSGGTAIDGGVLAVGSAGALGSAGTISFGGGTLRYSSGNATDYSGRFSTAAGQAYAIDTNGRTVTYATALTSAGGSLTKSGSGTLTLGGGSTFSGGVAVNAGTLATNAANRLPTSGTVAIAQGAALSLGGNQSLAAISGSGAIQLGANTLTTGSATSTFAGSISGNGGLTKVGPGTLTLSGSNTFKGDTTVTAGTLVLDSSTALDLFAIVTTATGATLQVNQNIRIGAYENNGTLTGSGTLASAFTITNSGTLAAVIADDGGPSGVLKRTAGTSVLDAANTYTGQTRVQAGTLTLGTSGTLAAASSLIVDPAATFSTGGKSQAFSTAATNGTVALGGGTLAVTQRLSGTGTIDGSVVVTGEHAPGNSPGIQSITGDLAYGSGASVAWELIDNTTTNSPIVFDQIVVGGTLAFNAATALSLSFDSLGSAVDWSDPFWGSDQSWTIYDVAGSTTGFSNLSISGTSWLDSLGSLLSESRPDASFALTQQGSDVVLTYTAVPEPATLALVACGAALLLASRRRSRAGSPLA